MDNQLMKKYESMGFDEGQLEEIRQGIEKGLTGFRWKRLRKGWSAG